MLTVMPPGIRDVLGAFLQSTESTDSLQLDYAVLLAALCQFTHPMRTTDWNVAGAVREGIWKLLALPQTLAALGTPASMKHLPELVKCYAVTFHWLYGDLESVARSRVRGRSKRAREMVDVIYSLVELPTVRAALTAASLGSRPIPSPAVLSTLHERAGVAAGFGEHGWLYPLCEAIQDLFASEDDRLLPTSPKLARSARIRKTMRANWSRLGAALAAGQTQEAQLCATGFDLGCRLVTPDLAVDGWAGLAHHVLMSEHAAASAAYAALQQIVTEALGGASANSASS